MKPALRASQTIPASMVQCTTDQHSTWARALSRTVTIPSVAQGSTKISIRATSLLVFGIPHLFEAGPGHCSRTLVAAARVAGSKLMICGAELRETSRLGTCAAVVPWPMS